MERILQTTKKVVIYVFCVLVTVFCVSASMVLLCASNMIDEHTGTNSIEQLSEKTFGATLSTFPDCTHYGDLFSKEDEYACHGETHMDRKDGQWLEAVGDKVAQNGPALNWLRKLKDIAYGVDDIVDEFQLEAERHDAHDVGGVVSNYLYAKPKSLILQCKAASKLKAVKKRFDDVVKQRTEFSTIANSLLANQPARDMNHNTANMMSLPTVDVASVLGRDQEKHQIISKLVETNDQQRIKTVSIIGLGGSGKTTLAKLVFNDCSIIEKHFEVRLWVHVSQEFDVEKLIKKLFEAFADNNPGQHALPYMSKTISDKLTGKRFLLCIG